MKKMFLMATLMGLCILSACDPVKPVTTKRDCGTEDFYKERLSKDNVFAREEKKLESLILEYTRKMRGNKFDFRSTNVTIPIVVHVVYNNATQNVSDAQIQSQIDVLNRDYRRLSTEIPGGPAAYTGMASDTHFQFALARRDPNCNPTTGIIRKSTTTASFTHTNSSVATVRNPVKFNSSGGDDAWPSDRYLNIWVCNLSGTLLGYASFPADMATRPLEDGVVMDFTCFGSTGTVAAPYNLGRTATHEIGHWLNLRHIWGDDTGDPDECSADDAVTDTPVQAIENYGCPSFPHVSCSNGPNGDMFMNFMDYTDDACMYLFTNGQSERMDATFWTTRASLASSLGSLPPPAAASAELFSKDTDEDVGNEANNESPVFYLTDDIWIRNTNDGLTNQEHQNPIGEQINYVYVRVRNKGCSPSTAANVKLYWAKASSGLAWPSPWDGSVTSPALMGNSIGSKPTGAVAGNGFVILEFPWTAPDPSEYSAFGADQNHFCLLSRIETATTAPFGMAVAETSNLLNNVKNNNNIVWKNVSVTDADGASHKNSVLLANYGRTAQKYTIKIKPYQGKTFGNTKVGIDKRSTFLKNVEDIRGTKGLEPTEREYVVAENGVEIKGVKMERGEIVSIIFNLSEQKRNPRKNDKQPLFRRNVNQFLVEQYSENGELIGGQLIKIKINN